MNTYTEVITKEGALYKEEIILIEDSDDREWRLMFQESTKHKTNLKQQQMGRYLRPPHKHHLFTRKVLKCNRINDLNP